MQAPRGMHTAHMPKESVNYAYSTPLPPPYARYGNVRAFRRLIAPRNPRRTRRKRKHQRQRRQPRRREWGGVGRLRLRAWRRGPCRRSGGGSRAEQLGRGRGQHRSESARGRTVPVSGSCQARECRRRGKRDLVEVGFFLSLRAVAFLGPLIFAFGCLHGRTKQEQSTVSMRVLGPPRMSARMHHRQKASIRSFYSFLSGWLKL